MQPFTFQQKSNIKNLAQKYNLKLLILFGSRAKGAPHEKSDYDIAVLSRKPRELRGAVGEFVG